MVHSLKTKLTVYFSVLLLFSLGSITILFNLTMDSLFAHYANDQRQSQIQQIIQQIEEQYCGLANRADRPCAGTKR